jgi:hypothetical protein
MSATLKVRCLVGLCLGDCIYILFGMVLVFKRLDSYVSLYITIVK